MFIFLVSFEDALENLSRRNRRNIPPALYNVRRLKELPIPDIPQVDQDESQRNRQIDQADSYLEEEDDAQINENPNDTDANAPIESTQSENISQGAGNSNNVEGQITNNRDEQNGERSDENLNDLESNRSIASNKDETAIQDASHSQNNEHVGCDTQNNDNLNAVVTETSDSFDTNHNDETSILEILILGLAENSNTEKTDETVQLNPLKIEAVPIHEPIQANNEELNELLDEEDMVTEKYDDEVTITIDSKIGFAMPLNSNSDGLIKRENDVISGNIAFNETVSIYNILNIIFFMILMLVRAQFRKKAGFTVMAWIKSLFQPKWLKS